MNVMTLRRYQEEVCKDRILDAGYWDRVVAFLHDGTEPVDWDGEGQPLYLVTDLLNAERAAKEQLLDS